MFFDDLEDVSYLSLPTQTKLLDTVNMSSYDESWLSPNASFPQKLFAMSLHEFDSMGKGIEWCASGTAFRVKDPESFAEDVLPKYFKHSKVTSFQRQLNLYGFRRITKGDDFGAYFHASFLRGRDDLVQNIRRFPTNKSMNMCMDGMMMKEQIDEKHPIYATESSSSSGSPTTTSVTGLVRKLDTTTKVGGQGQGLPAAAPLSSGSTATDPLPKRRTSGNETPVRTMMNGNYGGGFVGKMDQNRESISGDSLSKIFDVYLWQPSDMIPPTIIATGEANSPPILSPTIEMNVYAKPERFSMNSSGKGMDVDDNETTAHDNPMFPSQESFMGELMVIEDVAA